jgi:hypothetical protein
MIDAAESTRAQTSQDASPLLQRLDRRRTEAIGVVNLEPFNGRAAQVPGWIVQRSALLNQLTTRYSSQGETAGQAQDLVFASSQPVSPTDMPSRFSNDGPPTSLVRPPLPTVTAALPATPVAPATPPSAFRISRKPTAFSAATSTAQPGGAVPSPATRSEFSFPSPGQTELTQRSANTARIDSPLPPPQSPSGSTESSANSASLPIAAVTPTPSPVAQAAARSLILPKRVSEPPILSDVKGGQSVDAALSQPAPIAVTPAQPTLQTKPDSPRSAPDGMRDRPHPAPISPFMPTLPAHTQDLPFVLRRQSSESAAQPASSPSPQVDTAVNAPTAPPPSPSTPLGQEKGSIGQRLQRSVQALIFPQRTQSVGAKSSGSAQTSPALSSSVVARSSDSGGSSSDRSSAFSPSPIVHEISTVAIDSSLVLRKTQPSDSAMPDLPSSGQTLASPLTPPYPTAAEIPAMVKPLGQPTLVWRKAAETPSSPMYMQPSAPAIARQTMASPPLAGANEGTSTTTVAAEAPQTSMQMPNVAQIAEQVSRILHRQLTVERERRGINLW